MTSNEDGSAGNQGDPTAIAETGEWGTDCAAGKVAADVLADQIMLFKDGLALDRVLRRLVQSGRYGGVEVGFTARLSERIQARHSPVAKPTVGETRPSAPPADVTLVAGSLTGLPN